MHLLTPFLHHRAPRYPKPAVELTLRGARVVLGAGDPADWHAWRLLRQGSRDFLTPWEPAWPANAMSYGYFCGLLRRQWRDWREGKAYSFQIFLQSQTAGNDATAGLLIGGIALNSIERGVAQKGTLGYWLGQPYVGRGYMREAAQLVSDFAFQDLIPIADHNALIM